MRAGCCGQSVKWLPSAGHRQNCLHGIVSPTLYCIYSQQYCTLAGSRIVCSAAIASLVLSTQEMGEFSHLWNLPILFYVTSSHFVIVRLPAIVLVISFPKQLLKNNLQLHLLCVSWTHWQHAVSYQGMLVKEYISCLHQCHFLWTTSSTWIAL